MARIKMHIPKTKLPFYPPCEVKCRLQNGVSTVWWSQSAWSRFDGLRGCMTKSIGMVTIWWVKRMRDGSLIIESIGMVMIWWVKGMCDILRRTPDDGVDRHYHDLMGQEDAWRIPNDGVDWHGHDPMGRICWRPLDTWWPSGRSVLYIRMVSGKVPDDIFGDQILFWWAHDTFGNRRL